MKKILYILCFILTGSSAFLVSCDKPEELTFYPLLLEIDNIF